MNKIKFELNRAGVRELMQSKEMQNILISYANKVSARAGEGYDVYIGRNRANVQVATEAAEQDNFENNTLLKALKG